MNGNVGIVTKKVANLCGQDVSEDGEFSKIKVLWQDSTVEFKPTVDHLNDAVHGSFGERADFAADESLVQGDDLAGLNHGRLGQSSVFNGRVIQQKVPILKTGRDVGGYGSDDDVLSGIVKLTARNDNGGSLFDARKVSEGKREKDAVTALKACHKLHPQDYSRIQTMAQPFSQELGQNYEYVKGGANLSKDVAGPVGRNAKWPLQFAARKDESSYVCLLSKRKYNTPVRKLSIWRGKWLKVIYLAPADEILILSKMKNLNHLVNMRSCS